MKMTKKETYEKIIEAAEMIYCDKTRFTCHALAYAFKLGTSFIFDPSIYNSDIYALYKEIFFKDRSCKENETGIWFCHTYYEEKDTYKAIKEHRTNCLLLLAEVYKSGE
jgi:hypothetical protein